MSSPAPGNKSVSGTSPHPALPRKQGRVREGAVGERETRRVCVGGVSGGQWVRGGVRVKSFTAEPEGVAAYGPVEDERGERRFTLRLVGSAKGVLIAQIAGVEDRNAA